MVWVLFSSSTGINRTKYLPVSRQQRHKDTHSCRYWYTLGLPIAFRHEYEYTGWLMANKYVLGCERTDGLLDATVPLQLGKTLPNETHPFTVLP